ncbi:MAG: phosphoribosylglycinamide formyltransferase [Proteobacteria bacterium]|nr:phosphoribosylglycinamide formyltransferase [Cystobacterineae bacterium]MCL2259426.1 phosphoribosylglycinamide formyltransferase [Cystobacterineae bacterium]MCL2315310.1 phosphoribosylglycinamide formyltransferase [Pseudomonadota bacterium]
MKRIAVLASGNGSNLQALIDNLNVPDSPAEISLVVANIASAHALVRGRKAGIPTFFVPHEGREDRQNYETLLVQLLQEYETDFVCLAGFMRVLTYRFLNAFPYRVLNVHPALLPSFPGTHAPSQALRAGVKLSGCTIHLVDEGVDTGPILAQAAVPVLENDNADTLSARIQTVEHRLYPQAVRLFAEGRLRNKDKLFFLDGWSP